MVRPPTFAPKRLEIGSYVNIRVIRDDTKRHFFQRYEAERCVLLSLS